MHPTRYRSRLVLDFVRLLLSPCGVLYGVLHVWFPNVSLGYLTLPIYLLAIVLWNILRIQHVRLVHYREAKQLGASRIPVVVGKWPGNIDILFRMMSAFKKSYLLDVYLDLFKEYQCTTINLRIMWVDQIITMDQEHTKYLLSTGFDKFYRGTLQKERMETFLGDGIFNRDDEMWKMVQNSAFKVIDTTDRYRYTASNFSRVLSILSASESEGRPCEAQDLYARFTLDSASEFLFGHNINTLSANLPSPGRAHSGAKGSATDDTWGAFAQAFEMSQQVITNRARLGYIWPAFELFGDKSLPHQRVIRRWLDPLVKIALHDKLTAKTAGVTSSIQEKTFLQHLADNTDDPALIRDQLLSMLLAARDSTAALLTYVTYFLSLYPDVVKKLREEIIQHCGSQACPDYDKLKKLKYLRAVINETLRLFPPVPLNIRESRASCVLPPSDPTYSGAGGQSLYMPGRVNIVWLPMLIHRNKSLWGPDADNFDPDRWMQPERLAKFVANPFMYGPFSFGPRICVGQNYGLNEASYFLVRLLQHFDQFTLATEAQPSDSLPPPEWRTKEGRQAYEKIWPGAAMTLYVKGGMWVKFGRSEDLRNSP